MHSSPQTVHKHSSLYNNQYVRIGYSMRTLVI